MRERGFGRQAQEHCRAASGDEVHESRRIKSTDAKAAEIRRRSRYARPNTGPDPIADVFHFAFASG
jgi:hypothetical protein